MPKPNEASAPVADAVIETPQAPTQTQEQIDIVEAAKEIAKKRLTEQKAKNDTEVAKYQELILAAQKSVNAYQYLIDTDEETKKEAEEAPEKMRRRLDKVVALQAELANFKESLISPEQKDYNGRKAAAEKLLADLLKEGVDNGWIEVKVAQTRAAKSTGTDVKPTSDSQIVEFKGTLNPEDQDIAAFQAAWKSAVASGQKASETETLLSIYPRGDVNGNYSFATLKGKIHGRWCKAINAIAPGTYK